MRVVHSKPHCVPRGRSCGVAETGMIAGGLDMG